MQRPAVARRYSVGAEVQERGVHFRVWAPGRKHISVVIDGRDYSLEETDGFFSTFVDGIRVGATYQYRLDRDETLYPDPASRYQPEGPHGASAVVDPAAYVWSDAAWEGIDPDRAVIYELHPGTFTDEGTWAAAEERLEHLSEMGITVIELMPVSDFPGRFGWGYDGVDLWAPNHRYGTPDDLRRFIDHAHRLRLGVVLDVVYNHLGPDGNYLKQFADDYFTDRYPNEWGEAINFDGAGAEPVREYFASNAAYWIDEFHLDGLRLDATQSMHDSSEEHILSVITRRARDAARGKSIYLIAENEPQKMKVLRSIDAGGYDLDAVWNDDFHHSARVALTGVTEAYYSDYRGGPQEFVSMAKHGFLYQGQWYTWQKKHRGTRSIGFRRRAFIWYLENHDQVANSATGARLRRLSHPATFRAMTALLLLGPATPLLFQGQEFGSSRPFVYFADHHPELAELVKNGRWEFLGQFDSVAAKEMKGRLAVPHDLDVFRRSKLDWTELETNSEQVALHRDLLRIRRDNPPFAGSGSMLEGAVIAEKALVLRSIRDGGDDRLLLVNLGEALRLSPVPEPLLAAPEGKEWCLAWSSESPAYGGGGTPPVVRDGVWRIPPYSSLLLSAQDPVDAADAEGSR